MSRFASRSVLALLALLSLLSLSAPACVAKPADPAPAKAPGGKEEQQAAPDPSATDTYKQLTLFADILERARADYVDPVTDEKLVESAINGMLSSLDPHSGYLNKKNYEEMQTQTKGEFGGLGIEITMDNNLVKVISPIDDTPAAKAGLQPGDLITHLDAKPVTEMTLNEAVDKMRGVPGTKITLTVRRGGIAGAPFDLTLTRAIVHIQSVKWEAKDDIAYIRITTFNEQTQPGLDKALADAEKQIGAKLAGYVLDLRNNPGGLLDQAVSVSGTFLPASKEVVSTRSRHKDDNQSYTSKGGDKTGGKPMVVLINGGSASASEIVAGALQDYKRAILLGTKSFGKGSVQTIIPIAGAGAMRLTTARYYTPSGRSIQQLGIEPDIKVEPAKLESLESRKGLREADLRGALENDTVKKAKDQKEKEAAKAAKAKDGADKDAAKPTKSKAPDDELDDEDATLLKDGAKDGKDKDGKDVKPFDYPLARALDLLRGIRLYEQRTPSVDAAPQSAAPASAVAPAAAPAPEVKP